MGLLKLTEITDFERILFLQKRVKDLLKMVKSVLNDNKNLEIKNSILNDKNVELEETIEQRIQDQLKIEFSKETTNLRKQRKQNKVFLNLQIKNKNKSANIKKLTKDKNQLLADIIIKDKELNEIKHKLLILENKIKRDKLKTN